MQAATVFPGKFLKAADLGTSSPTVTIDRVVMEKVGEDMRPVMYFRGKERGLAMNKTNWAMVEELTGKMDSDHWTGAAIQLYVAKVDYQGKRVPAIRIREAATSKKPSPAFVREPGDNDEDDITPSDSDLGF